MAAAQPGFQGVRMYDEEPRGAGIHFPPPLLYILGFGLGWMAGRWLPVPLLPAAGRSAGIIAGWGLVGAGLLIMLGGLLQFVSARTAVVPFRPARHLVTTGLYHFSRNPMYVGLTAAYLGGVLLTNNFWCLLALPLVLMLMNGWIISREERYLAAVFGESYRQYCTRVRRWL